MDRSATTHDLVGGALQLTAAKVRTVKAPCTISQKQNGTWIVRHSSDSLGTVEITGSTREQALTKMRDELQYRLELCPCSGEVLGTVELQVSDEKP